MTTPEVRRLHRLSWLFMTATAVKGLIVPAIIVLFASSTSPVGRYELLSLLVVGPALVGALLKQGIYTYRFTADELVIREGLLIRKERHIPYDRVHNVAMVRNPVHRMLGVASARVETAAGGEPEAVMRVLSLQAIDELRRYALGKERAAALKAADQAAAPDVAAGPPGAAAGPLAGDDLHEGGQPSHAAAADVSTGAPTLLLKVPAGELVRLGLISNRGFIVVAALLGLMSQANWWDQDWESYYSGARDRLPEWAAWMLAPGSTTVMVLLGVAAVLLLVVLLRLFSVAWYLLKYYDFVLQRDEGDLRTEFGLLTRVSTLIPVRRIQLLTVSASLLHRCFGRAGIDLETAGAIEGGDDGDQLASLGLKTSRQWLAPIIAAQRASTLVRSIIPEIEIEHVAWQPLAARTTHRILRRSLLALAVLGGGIMTLLAWTPIPLSGWHALWVPAIGTPLAYFGTTAWVRYSGWALTDDAVLFRSGWLAQRTSAVLFDKMQTVTLRQSPFDRRHHMASVAVDTAGAGGEGHRIAIPYLDVEVAQRIFERLYAETRATEFNW